jgi:hypothetical protein
MLLLGPKPELTVYTQPTQPQSFPYQVSSDPRSPGDWARPLPQLSGTMVRLQPFW